ncbi:MAG: glycosyltransferase family 4 protein [bacterium]
MDTIRLGLISCWYKEKSCGRFAHNLAQALTGLGVEIEVISANCLCFRDDPFHPELFFSPCHKVRFPDFYWKPAPLAISYLRAIGELAADAFKGFGYLAKAKSPAILHYQQTQGSFGFLPLLSFLSYPTQARRVISIHEIDSIQKQLKVGSKAFSTIKLNRIYHKADAIVVQNAAAGKALEALGVTSERVHIIPHGTHIPAGISRLMEPGALPPARHQIAFCGGHHLTSGKGFDAFLKALLILRAQGVTPPLMIYGLNEGYGQEKGQKLIHELGISNKFKWLDYRSDESLFAELQTALCMVIPYTTSEAGAAVTAAMANAVPVIATRKVGLPEYLGESGLYIEEDNPQDLADTMLRLIQNPGLVNDLGRQLHRRALEQYSWEAVGRKTLDLYEGLLGE